MRHPHSQVQIASVVSLIASFALFKTVALMYGPEGVGYQGAVLSAGLMIGGLALLNANTTIPLLVGYDPTASRRGIARAVRRLLLVTSLPALIFGLVAMLGPFSEFAVPVAVLGITLCSLAWVTGTVRAAIIASYEETRVVARQTLISVGLSTTTTAGLLFLLPLELLPIAVGVGALAGQIAAIAATRPPRQPSHQSESSITALTLARKGLYPYLGSLAATVGHAALPLLILSIAGAEIAGLYRAAATLAVALPGTTIGALAHTFFPKVSQAMGAQEDPGPHVRSALSRSMALAVPATLVLSALAPILLTIAYDNTFVTASACLTVATVAALLQILVSVTRYTMLAIGKEWAGMWVQVASMAIMTCGTVFAANSHSLIGIAVVQCVAWLVWLGAAEVIVVRAAPEASLTRCLRGGWVLPATMATIVISTLAAWIWAIQFPTAV